MQLLGLIAHLPRSLDCMPNKTYTSKTARVQNWVQFLKADEFILVPWELSQMKEMPLLHCCKCSKWVCFTFFHCGTKLLSSIHSYALYLRKYLQKTLATSHTHMWVSCMSAWQPDVAHLQNLRELWPQGKVCILPCRLQNGCTQLLEGRFAEAL